MGLVVTSLARAFGMKGVTELEALVDVMVQRRYRSDGARCPSIAEEGEAFATWVIAEGGILPKAAQILAERPDVVKDEDYRKALSRCQVACQPVTYDEIVEVLRSEGLQEHIDWESLDPIPISTGSIGQVHRCDELVVKVSLERKREEMERQFAWLDAVVLLPGVSASIMADMHAVITPMKSMILEEFNLNSEASNLLRAAAAIRHLTMLFGKDFPVVGVPSAWCRGDHVLLMAREKGCLLKDLLCDPSARSSMPKYIGRVVRFYGACVLRLGWFHSDPHPGNIMFESDGRMVVLDWGCVVQLELGEAKSCRALFHVLVEKGEDVELAKNMRDLGFQTKYDTDEGLVSLARCVFASSVGTQAFKADADPVSLGASDDPPDIIPSRMAQLIRVIGTLEGTARGAGCPLQVAEEWRPFLATSNAFTSAPRGQQNRTSLMIQRRASRARRSMRCSKVGGDGQMHPAKPMIWHTVPSPLGRQLLSNDFPEPSYVSGCSLGIACVGAVQEAGQEL